MKKIYLVMAKSRVRGTEIWDKPEVLYANTTKKVAESDVKKSNERQDENNILEFHYFVQEIKLFK